MINIKKHIWHKIKILSLRIKNYLNKTDYTKLRQQQILDIKDRFWEKKALNEMTESERELICDGCGKCCLAKIDSLDKKSIQFTNVACRLLDLNTGYCKLYEHRKKVVSDCVKVSFETLKEEPRWLPKTCAYWRLYKGYSLPDWHPLLTKDIFSPHKAGVSVCWRTISETNVKVLEHHLVDWSDL